jgi:hypothetical protein
MNADQKKAGAFFSFYESYPMLDSSLSQTHQIDLLRNIFENIEDIVNILKKILTKPPFLIIFAIYI